MLVISPSIVRGQSERTNGTILESWLMLDHHDLLRTHQTRWQESSAGTAVSGDSIPINGNLIPALNDGKAGWLRHRAEIELAALAHGPGKREAASPKDHAQTTS
jgi:hypothetical protein